MNKARQMAPFVDRTVAEKRGYDGPVRLYVRQWMDGGITWILDTPRATMGFAEREQDARRFYEGEK